MSCPVQGQVLLFYHKDRVRPKYQNGNVMVWARLCQASYPVQGQIMSQKKFGV